ncbi:unnamed protein product [Vicia faba]|uniref:hAT-like transposase RNase-H fold domain-containing protein n=1 Tax=Vicia faba TaxID=3906 RepID=A0AAV0ZI94_VICFA|nr:unnamed protein product [Vicia faba]
MNKLIYFGVILDPRFKLRYVEWTFKHMYGVGFKFSSDLLKTIKESLKKLYDWYKQVYDQKHGVGQPIGSGGQASNSETNIDVACSSIMARVDAFEKHLEEQDSIDLQNELEGYLSNNAFSTGERVIETYRSSLTAEMVEASICT